MPIKPENRHRYPADWKQVRLRILQRAKYRCEHQGCRAQHGVTGYWRNGRFVRMPEVLWNAGFKAGDTVACNDGERLKIIKVVLTIAHLDHTPENCADDNLRAWCQRHHLAYDAAHHRANAYATRRARAGTLELF